MLKFVSGMLSEKSASVMSKICNHLRAAGDKLRCVYNPKQRCTLDTGSYASVLAPTLNMMSFQIWDSILSFSAQECSAIRLRLERNSRARKHA